eukprot:14114727-Alexandrium_andersonii.AAC.1
MPSTFSEWMTRFAARLAIRPPSTSKWTSFPALVRATTALRGSHPELNLAAVLLLREKAQLDLAQ